MSSKLGDSFNLVGGGTPTTSIEEYWGSGTPWISSADIDQSGHIVYRRKVTPFGVSNSTTNVVPRGTVIVVTRVGLGKVAQLTEDTCFSQDIQALLAKENTPAYSSSFLMYQLLYKMQTVKYSGRGTTISGITKKQLADVSLYLPPLSEQERIVARIEELFSQLDAGVETLKKTKAQLAVYRQAVLKEAFDSVSGNRLRIEDVCKEIKVGIVIKPTQYYVDADGVFAFRNANVRRGYIDDHDWVMISKEGHKKNQKSEVHTGDVLISRSGANLGMASPVSETYDGYNAIDVVIAVPDKTVILPAFLAHYTNSPMGRSIVKKNERGAAQGHLNVTVYSRLPIVVPSITEQQAIIDTIEGKISVCDSIEQTIAIALQQSEAMRQSILKQAFEGRL